MILNILKKCVPVYLNSKYTGLLTQVDMIFATLTTIFFSLFIFHFLVRLAIRAYLLSHNLFSIHKLNLYPKMSKKYIFYILSAKSEDKSWAPHVYCVNYNENLVQWIHCKKKSMSFAFL